MTPSLIGKSQTSAISPWTSQDALATLIPLLEGANQLRRSLVPSLIAARLYNQSQSNRDAQLFETANVYLPSASGLPGQQFNLGVIGLTDIRGVAGAFEEICIASAVLISSMRSSARALSPGTISHHKAGSHGMWWRDDCLGWQLNRSIVMG